MFVNKPTLSLYGLVKCFLQTGHWCLCTQRWNFNISKLTTSRLQKRQQQRSS